MTPSYRIRGNQQSSATALTTSKAVVITGRRRVVPGLGREAGTGEIEANGDEVVRVELDNGFVLWIRTDDLVRESGRKETGRGSDDPWEISLEPSLRAAARGQRGWAGMGIKALEFFGVDLKQKAAGAIGKAFEEKMLMGRAPGLYRCSLGDQFALAPLAKSERMATDKPILLFLHGTASSCEGSLSKLWSSHLPEDCTRKKTPSKRRRSIHRTAFVV